MEKLYYTIGEVAQALGESVSLVRFWSDSFPRLVRPRRNAKGNRLFSSGDLETLRQIHYLVKEKGMTLEGAERHLVGQRSEVESRVKVLTSLRTIRARLVEIKKSL